VHDLSQGERRSTCIGTPSGWARTMPANWGDRLAGDGGEAVVAPHLGGEGGHLHLGEVNAQAAVAAPTPAAPHRQPSSVSVQKHDGAYQVSSRCCSLLGRPSGLSRRG
jgi:hypothetical protein